MFDEDYCPRDSPDLWRESLDCQDDAETQYVDDLLANNMDDETEEEIESDETVDNAINDRNFIMDSNDDTIKNSINDSYTTAEYMNKLMNTPSSSSKIQQICPVPTACEMDSQKPGSSNTLTLENNDFRLNSSQRRISRKRASNINNRIIISDISESKNDIHASKRVFNTVKNDDNYSKALITSTKTVDGSSLFLKDKKNFEKTNADSDSDDDSFSEEFLSAKFTDYKVKNWLKKNKQENLWLQTELDLRMRTYTNCEQQCMLYYLISTNSMSNWNLFKTWAKMKEQYKYLRQCSAKSLVGHFDRTIQYELHRFNLPYKNY